MKRSFVAIVLASITVISGCLDVETKTVVEKDGTLTRTVTFKGDSNSVYRGQYPLTIDDSWPSSIRKVEEKKFEFSATRTFAGSEELNEAIKAVPNKTMQIHVSLETSFRWFVTDYHYSETYRRWCPFDNVPITDFISRAELEAAMRHELEDEPFDSKGDSLALAAAGDRFEEWDTRNQFESYFAVFLKGVRQLADPGLQPDIVVKKKEDLFTASREPIDQAKMDTVFTIFGSILKTKRVRQAFEANAAEFQTLKDQLNFKSRISGNSYKVSVEMPGIITETNAKSIEGNSVHFSDFLQVAYFQDHEMWVTSRAINWWAVIVTAGLIIAGGVVLIVGKRRKSSV